MIILIIIRVNINTIRVIIRGLIILYYKPIKGLLRPTLFHNRVIRR